jgi:hypothetical protein
MKKLLLLPLLMIACFCFAQDAKDIIGKPVKIGTLLVAEKDFQKKMIWDDAKKACSALGKGWRLPTKSELNLLYKNKEKIEGFANNDGSVSPEYFSSTELGPSYVWVQIFDDTHYGKQGAGYKYYDHYVRAVKSL